MSITEPASFSPSDDAGDSDAAAQTQASLPEEPDALDPQDSAADGPGGRSASTGGETTRRLGRIGGLDVARGLAVLGMVYVNFAPIGDGDDRWSSAHSILSDIPNGRSVILFALVAGISLSLLTGRDAPYTGERMATARKRIVGRAFMLVFLSMLTSLLNLPVIVVLSYYAVWFVLALPFTSWSVRKLWTAAAATAVVGPILSVAIVWVTASLGLVAQENDPFLWTMLIAGNYPGLVYMAFIFAGMAIGKSCIAEARHQAKLVALGAALMILGYGGSYVLTHTLFDSRDTLQVRGAVVTEESGGSHVSPDSSSDGQADPPPADPDSDQREHAFDWAPVAFDPASQLVTANPHANTVFEVVGSGGFAIALTGLCLLIGRASRNVLRPLAAVGSMSLTVYATHLVILGTMPDLANNSWEAVLWMSVGALIVCGLWRLFYRRGPLEWAMWRFSYYVAGLLSAERIAPPSGAESTGSPETVSPARAES